MKDSHYRWAHIPEVDYPVDVEDMQGDWEPKLRKIVRIITGREPGRIVKTVVSCSGPCQQDDDTVESNRAMGADDIYEEHGHVVFALGGKRAN